MGDATSVTAEVWNSHDGFRKACRRHDSARRSLPSFPFARCEAAQPQRLSCVLYLWDPPLPLSIVTAVHCRCPYVVTAAEVGNSAKGRKCVVVIFKHSVSVSTSEHYRYLCTEQAPSLHFDGTHTCP